MNTDNLERAIDNMVKAGMLWAGGYLFLDYILIKDVITEPAEIVTTMDKIFQVIGIGGGLTAIGIIIFSCILTILSVINLIKEIINNNVNKKSNL